MVNYNDFGSYYFIASDSYIDAKERYNAKRYKACCLDSHHAIECFLKAVFEIVIPDSESRFEMKSHNLELISRALIPFISELESLSDNLKLIGNYYFNLRYPGSLFTTAQEKDAELSIKTLDTVRNLVSRFLGIQLTTEF